MNSRAVLFFLFALLFAGATAYTARAWLAGQRPPAPASAKIVERPAARILVAAADLMTGSFVHAQDLKWQSWPDDQITELYMRKPDETTADPGPDPLQSLVGGVVR